MPVTLSHMARGKKHPEGTDPFDVTLPKGFELGEHEATLEAAAKGTDANAAQAAKRAIARIRAK